LAEGFQQLNAKEMLSSDELGAVLASLGPDGNGRDRLTAVVALLASQAGDTDTMVRGAFAGAGPKDTAKVRSAFTTALHSCLREQSVNAGSPATTRSV
jgi:hypothetical protein